MDNKDKVIRVQVSFHANSATSHGVLVDLIFDKQGRNIAASRLEWFPMSLCHLEKTDNEGFRPSYFLNAPKWLLDKKNVKYADK